MDILFFEPDFDAQLFQMSDGTQKVYGVACEALDGVCNIACVGAELPMAVAIDGKFLPASRTGIGVDCLPLHQLQMCIPPLIPAGIATEPFPLPSRILFNRLSALLTDCPAVLAARLCRRQNDFTVLMEIWSRAAILPYPAPSRRRAMICCFCSSVMMDTS